MKKALYVLLISSMLLCGCNGGSSDYDSYESADSMAMSEEFYQEPESLDMNNIQFGTAMKSASVPAQNENQVSEPEEARKLIRTTDLTLESKDFMSTVNSISDKVSELGGYFESTNIYGSEEYSSRCADLHARIPKDRMDEFLTAAKNTGNVTSISENMKDVTLQYTDTESRITAVTTERERILELLEKAEDIETIVVLENKLSELNYKIENYTSTLRVLNSQIDYSEATIRVEEVEVFVPKKKDTFLNRISTGFASDLKMVCEYVVDVVVFLISHIPSITLLLLEMFLFFGIIFLLVKWIIRKNDAWMKKQNEKYSKKNVYIPKKEQKMKKEEPEKKETESQFKNEKTDTQVKKEGLENIEKKES